MENFNDPRTHLKLTELTKLCYIATPYRGTDELVVEQNLLNARKAAVAMMQQHPEYFPMNPVLNSAGFHHYEDMMKNIGDVYWLNGTKEMLNRCDAIYLSPGWEASSGCIGEIEFILNQMIGTECRDIKIFINMNEGSDTIIEVNVEVIADIVERINK